MLHLPEVVCEVQAHKVNCESGLKGASHLGNSSISSLLVKQLGSAPTQGLYPGT